ncbi:MAG: S8 family serine peptidase [Planctomycetota bacterium]|nr:S8 family serine peptidase [Planctomycetota bacterium]
MRLPVALLPVLLAACGGGGGSGNGITVEGRLVVVTQAIAPQRALRTADVAARAACLRVGSGPVAGVLDTASDVDAFRRIASHDGAVTAVASGSGAAVLHDLARGTVARSLTLRRGDPFDVVVSGRRGAFEVALVPRAGDTTARELPETYRDCGEGFAAGEIVAAPVDGVDGHELAARYGAECVHDTRPACLLRVASTPAGGEFERLCRLLVLTARMEADGFVRYAEPNSLRRLAIEPTDPLFGNQWAMQQIRAPAAWDIARNAVDVLVGFVDSGVRFLHPDLGGRVVAGYDFRDDDDDPTDPTTNFSHGTQVAGVIAAAANNGEGLAGMIWDGRALAIRAFGTTGFGTAFDISEAIRYGAGLVNRSGTVPPTRPVALNLSFASTVRTQVEEDAIVAAVAAGVFVVAATGNNGRRDDYYPAAYAAAFAVGASGINGDRAGFSNYGAYVDILAPGGSPGNGVQVTGVDTGGFAYPFVEGTSFACPLAAAMAALMVTVRSDLTVTDIGDILRDTAQDIRETGFDEQSGFGILDSFHALLSASGLDTPVLMPGEKVEVRVFRLPEQTLIVSAETSDAQALRFTLGGLAPGEYRIVAGTDRNFDDDITGEGEITGVYVGPDKREVLVIDAASPPDEIEIAIQKR